MRFALVLLLAGCASVPEQKIVAHVESLPPVSKAVAVTCVKSMPEPPAAAIDPNATFKQRYYQMRAAIDDLDRYYKEAQIALDACAKAVP